MKNLRDYAIVLGLAGIILMVAADTKDVEATGKVSYQSENSFGEGFISAGTQILEYSNSHVILRQLEMTASEKESEEEPQPEESEELEEMEEVSGRVIELSEDDYTALVKLVEAEASGEDTEGKMLVANVVLNRVADEAFPDTVEQVVYQKRGNSAQFSPVSTGKIERVTVSDETREAVERVLCGEDRSQGALYFIAREYASEKNIQWFEQNLTYLFSHHGHEFFA
jgi:spore germination cell wall hydrolase CwlJ-like protein